MASQQLINTDAEGHAGLQKAKEESRYGRDRDEERTDAHSIVGRSPFNSESKKVLQEVQGALEEEEAKTPHGEKNQPSLMSLLVCW